MTEQEQKVQQILLKIKDCTTPFVFHQLVMDFVHQEPTNTQIAQKELTDKSQLYYKENICLLDELKLCIMVNMYQQAEDYKNILDLPQEQWEDIQNMIRGMKKIGQ